MIITRIRGGLGNQLFQYAAGHAASLRYSQSHFLDLRFYESDKYREYGLDRFNISAGIASSEVLPPAKETELAQYAIWKHFGTEPKYVKDMDFVKASRIKPKFAGHKFVGNAYMAGLWCSENFFDDFAAEVRNELTFKDKLSERGSEVLRRINGCTSVSLHVRRGDFVQNKAVHKRFGVCSVNYYTRALGYLSGVIGSDFRTFVFSDDLQWAKENLRHLGEVSFVTTASTRTPHEDLILMAACNHHITSNSTFSWWGAWLDANPEKLVVCPEKWYAARRKRKYRMTADGWVSIPAFS